MTADMLHHHLDLTSANNLLTIHHHHHHHQHHNDHDQGGNHQTAASITSDQYSSLNLSSVGSSASSAHHSPIMEHYEAETMAATAAAAATGGANSDHHRRLQADSNQQRRPSSLEGHFSAALKLSHLSPGRNSSACSSHLGASSDYTGSQASLPPCSPLSLESPSSCCSPLEADLTSLSAASSPCKPQQLQQKVAHLCANNQQINSNNITTSNHHHHHLHPNDHQRRREQFAAQQQQQQKVRSFSHTTSFSPFQELQQQQRQQQQQDVVNEQHKQPVNEEIIERPRRLSRIENRQSLHDLGYGQIESYFKLQRLGKGTYATVYMGRSRVNNDLVALKEILKEHDEGAPCTAIREVSLLRLLRHNNIVTLHDICHTPKKLTLVFEYVGPDLYAYMKENNHLLSIHNVRLLLFQLLRGIAFCHSRQVLHRDLKPQNLLINTRGELKICDFGLARAKSIPTKSYSNEVVTLWYRPPDVLLGNTDYNDSIDMWGVGCIFYEMASGRTFFPGSSVRQQLYLIFSSLGAPQANNWPEMLTNPEYLSYSFPSFRPEKLAHRVPRLDQAGVHLLQSFLRFKPSERLAAHEAMREPFFECLPSAVHALHERESIFDVPGVYLSLNPGQKLQNQQNQQYFHSQ